MALETLLGKSAALSQTISRGNELWPNDLIVPIGRSVFIKDEWALNSQKHLPKSLLKVYQSLSNIYQQEFGKNCHDSSKLNSSHIIKRGKEINSTTLGLLKNLGYVESKDTDYRSGSQFSCNVPNYGSVRKANAILREIFKYGRGNDALTAFIIESALETGNGIGGASQLPTLRQWLNETGYDIYKTYKKLASANQKTNIAKCVFK